MKHLNQLNASLPKAKPSNVVALALLLISISLVLFGCGHTPPKPDTAIDQTREVKFDKRLIKDCEKLPALASAREIDVQDWSKQVLRIHNECATFKAKENTEIKKALNLKD